MDESVYAETANALDVPIVYARGSDAESELYELPDENTDVRKLVRIPLTARARKPAATRRHLPNGTAVPPRIRLPDGRSVGNAESITNPGADCNAVPDRSADRYADKRLRRTGW
jgi:hypothetical protein